jgi:hypothetical protein
MAMENIRYLQGDSVRYINWLRDNADKALFFVVFTLGAIFIVVTKAYALSQFAVTSVPVALIVAYATAALATAKFRLREDRIAENCYYLGLLFTLVSLACALYAFTADAVATRKIITNFGVALSTTIVGLTLRVLISQLREDPVEYEAEARLELAEATAKLTGELHSSVEDLASFRRSMFQVLEEGMAQIASKANEAIQETAQSVVGAGKAAVGGIDASLNTFDAQTGRINVAAERTAGALEDTFARIEVIDTSSDMIARKLDPLVHGFRSLLEESTARARAQAAEFNRITKSSIAANDAVDRLEQTHRAMQGSLEALNNTLAHEMNAGANAVSHFTQSVEGIAAVADQELGMVRQRTASLAQMLAEDIENIRRLRNEAERELETAHELVGRTHTSLAILADQITDRVSVAG